MTQYYSRTDINYAGDSNFTIPFSYIDKEDIHVYVNDTEITTWTWLNDSQIDVTSTLTTGDVITIKRETPIDEKIITYQNMSMVLSDENLNLSQDQLLNAVQEMYDGNVSFQIDVDAQIDTIDGKVNTANSTANTALANSQTAVSTANSAETKANNAVSTANTASSNASSAVSTANSAASTATTAYNTATTAKSTADTAKSTADTAIEKANTAISTANTASTNASNAVSTANTASSNASSAVTTANSALSTATSAASTASTASTNASTALSTANSAASDASDALTAANAASDKVDEFEEDIESVIAAAEEIEELEDAVTAATTAATEATAAATAATAAASTFIVDQTYDGTSTHAQSGVAIQGKLANYALSSSLATVATSGSYNDLSNKPTIPTVNNATLTIQKNGTTVNTFTANASSDVTCNITVPTQASDISGCQTTSNLVTSVSSSSTDSQYPSAKLFYDTVGNIETLLQAI